MKKREKTKLRFYNVASVLSLLWKLNLGWEQKYFKNYKENVNFCLNWYAGKGKLINEDKWYEQNISYANINTGDSISFEQDV